MPPRRIGPVALARLTLWVVLLATCLAAAPARAQIGSGRYAAIVTEAGTGNVLIAANPDEPRHPASLTKMMTLYLVFEALRDRRLTLDELVPVSAHAASQAPSKLGLLPSTRITVEQAILGLVTKSANDAAAALGEMLGGDEDRFAQMMTLRARALGMTRTVFRNASGLPDAAQISTARDLALLARHLVEDFPAQYRYFSTPSFQFHGQTILNHDHLLQTYPGADGIKTGYTEASGFNLVTSAVRGEVRLIGVVLGAAHPGERDQHMQRLLDQGFELLNIPPLISHQGPAAGLVASTQASGAEASAGHPHAPSRWSVWIEGLASEAAARTTASTAHRAADAGEVRIEAVTAHGHTSYRVLLTGLSQSDARQACAAVAHRKLTCTPIRPENGQLASR
jgi:D-alanyl-D-alanine carboxypeptidase